MGARHAHVGTNGHSLSRGPGPLLAPRLAASSHDKHRVQRVVPRVAAVHADTAVLRKQLQEEHQAHQQQQQRSHQQAPQPGEEPVPSIFRRCASEHPDAPALVDPHKQGGLKVTYGELWDSMTRFGAGLRALGLSSGRRVSLFSENSSRWLVADQGIHLCGGVDAVRGSTAPLEELKYIMTHSDSVGVVLQDLDALAKMAPALSASPAGALKFVVLLWGSRTSLDEKAASLGLPAGLALHTYEEVLATGDKAVAANGGFEPAPISRADLATLVYTSGTTGHPKAVMLSHGNLMNQVENLNHFLPVKLGDTTLSLLPPWHIYERATSYYILSRGATQVYTSIRKFKDDLPKYKPDYFVCVPLVLDTLHSKVMSNLRTLPGVRKAVAMALLAASQTYVRARRTIEGTALRYARAPPPPWQLLMATLLATLLAPLHALAQKLVFAKVRDAVGIKQTVISGGGALAPHLDDFYEALGLEVLNGWGLSETSPVLACRTGVQAARGPNVRGAIGKEMPGTSLRVVDPETLTDVADGALGLILARGPGVMQGYLDDPAATARAFPVGGGWFDTGDLGWRAPSGVSGSSMAGVYVLTGRAKDTIVMASGKNVEPEPIEGALQCSPLVRHAILLGQDKRELGALIFADEDAIAAMGADAPQTPAQLEELLSAEVAKLNSARPDYQTCEHVAHVGVVRSPLSVEDFTLTRTMKPRRPEIARVYAKETAALLKRLRG